MDARRFLDKTVVITGAAHGIGAATARRFLAEGARVAAIDREADEFADLQAQAEEGRLLAIAGDCTDAGALADFHARALAAFGADRRALQQCRPERPGARGRVP